MRTRPSSTSGATQRGLRGGHALEALFGAREVAAVVQHAGFQHEERGLLAADLDGPRHARMRAVELSRLVLGHPLQVPHLGAARAPCARTSS